MSIKLTIGTAVYNVGKAFLDEHIEGVAKQLTDETELLLIDDCSTDDSGDVCRAYAEKYEHVRYIRMDKNRGLSAVRNRTIAEAAGKWIFFADGDDLLSEYAVGAALAFSDTDADVIVHDRALFVETPAPQEACTVKELAFLPQGAGRELSLSCLCINPVDTEKLSISPNVFYHAAWAALYRRDFLLAHDLTFPEGQKKAQDSVFNAYTYFCAEKIAYLPYTMYYYRNNAQGITKRYSADFAAMATSLVRHHETCIRTLYNDDPTVHSLYRNHRVISLTLDAMRLNFFHKDNKKPKSERKAEFTEFIRTEPFKSAIENFDLDACDWWGWRLPIRCAKQNRFGFLDYAFRHEKFFRLCGGVDTRLLRLKRRLRG